MRHSQLLLCTEYPVNVRDITRNK